MSEWQETKLKQLTKKIGSGATPRGGQEAYYNSGISLIRSQNVLDFEFSNNGLAFIDEAQAQKLGNVVVEKDDILLNIIGDSVARVCKVPCNVLPARVNQHVSIIRSDHQKIDSNFLLYFLLNPTFKQHLLKLASDGGTRNALTKSDLESLLIHVPPLDEQISIAKVLSSLDRSISNLRKQNETLEKIAQTLFKHWFIDFEFPNEDGKPYKSSGGAMVRSDLGEIPVGWRVGKLGELIIVNPKESTKKGKFIKYVDMKSLSTSGMEITDFIIRDFTSGSRFKNDDTLLARITPCLENGKTAFVNILDENEVAYGSTEFIVMRAKAICCLEYVYCLSRSPYFRDYAIKNMTGSSGRQRVPNDRVENYEIEIPNSAVMKGFHEVCNSLFLKIKSSQRQIQTLTKTRDRLLSQLMSGKLRITES